MNTHHHTPPTAAADIFGLGLDKTLEGEDLLLVGQKRTSSEATVAITRKATAESDVSSNL